MQVAMQAITKPQILTCGISGKLCSCTPPNTYNFFSLKTTFESDTLSMPYILVLSADLPIDNFPVI
jgi:hypothetical protein